MPRILLLLCLLTLSAGATPRPPAAAEFIANQGQWPAAVRFAAPLQCGQLFLEASGFTYALLSPRPHRGDSVTGPRRGHAYRVRFVGAQTTQPQGEELTGEQRNYLCGDPASWARAVPSFRQVRYPDLYPGVSLRLHGSAAGELEYSFDVAPGGQAGAIALRYEGAEALRLDAAGQLHVRTSVGEVVELAPQAWQSAPDGTTRPVSCRFVLRGRSVSFALAGYDPARALVIDPVVQFASFTGSKADNWGHTATYDAQGNLYSAGTVFGAGYPVSPGAFDPTFNGSIDLAIIKYNTTQVGPAARAYATYLGGKGTDVPHRLVVDAQGELLVLGTTSSDNFPTTGGAYNRDFRGGPALTPENGIKYPRGSDLFVTRLSADGQQLRASTLLGGTGTDGLPYGTGAAQPVPQYIVQQGLPAWRGDLLLDPQGNVCVATATASADFPAAGSFQTRYRGGRTDAVVCQLSGDLRTLRWSAFLGGTNGDAAFGLSLGPGGLLYVCGATTSADFPTTATAYQGSSLGGTDGFVAAISLDGQTLRYATRTGSAQSDDLSFVQADAEGVFVAGLTTGLVPSSAGSLASATGGVLLQRFSPALDQREFSATLAASPNFSRTLTAFRADNCGRLYLALVGYTDGLPLTQGRRPVDATYLACLSPRGQHVQLGTCYGGDHTHGISRLGPDGALYQAICGDCSSRGNTFSTLPTNAYYTLTSTGPNCNDASLKVAIVPDDLFVLRQQICADAAPLPLPNGAAGGGAWSGPGVRATATGYEYVPTPALAGIQVLTFTPTTPDACALRRMEITVATVQPVAFTPPGGPFCATVTADQRVYLQATPAGGTFSGPGVEGDFFLPNIAGPGTHTLTYTVVQPLMCGRASQTVKVLGTKLTIGPDTTLCYPNPRPFQLRASPAGGSWSGPGVSATGWFDPATAGTYARPQYRYTGPDGCQTVASRLILVAPAPPVLPRLDFPGCALTPDINAYAPYTLQLPFVPQPAGGSFFWEFGDGETSASFIGDVPVLSHTYTQTGTFTPVLQGSFNGACPQAVSLGTFTLGEATLPPNVITPNGDGLNDAFVQRQYCEPPSLWVYSRWGQEVYHAARYQNDWPAAGLPAGTYFYRFVGEQGRELKGWLEVLR